MKLIITILYTFFLLDVLRSVVFGGLPFWYDPARDMLLAWDNHAKLSLIGQPGGIPGVFYGPFWIWGLSLVLLFTKDPRWVVVLVLAVPYFLILPVLLKRLKLSMAFILLMANFRDYAAAIWNPHLAPFIFIVFIYFLYQNNFFLAGLLAGSLTSFHLSFATAVIAAYGIYLLIRRKSKDLIMGILGIVAALSPLIVFEIKHGFNISRSYVWAMVNSSVFNSAVVGQTGISKSQILEQWFGISSKIFGLPAPFGLFIIVAVFILTVRKVSGQDRGILKYLLFLLFLIFSLYFGSKNPVWSYYFIGVETILIIILAILLKPFPRIKNLLIIWIFITMIPRIGEFVREFPPKYYLVSGLATKEHVVDDICHDSGQKFSWAAYDSAIYTFDYDYLFRWRCPKPPGEVTYLIIPAGTKPEVALDFISYKTPGQVTIREMAGTDGTRIIRRESIRKL